MLDWFLWWKRPGWGWWSDEEDTGNLPDPAEVGWLECPWGWAYRCRAVLKSPLGRGEFGRDDDFGCSVAGTEGCISYGRVYCLFDDDDDVVADEEGAARPPEGRGEDDDGT